MSTNFNFAALDPDQLAAASSSQDEVLLIAGAGSGKTTTLVARIIQQAQAGAALGRVVAITYTNAAADELERRLAAAGASERLGYVGTLHGFCLAILRRAGGLVGLPPDVGVFDDDEREPLLRSIMAEIGSRASLKATLPLLSRPDLIFSDGKYRSLSREELAAAEYHARLRRAGLVDFDGILAYGQRAAGAWAAASERGDESWAWPYTHLFVDEYQDASRADAAVYAALPCRRKFFVGDPDQAIYGFRGGDVANIVAHAARLNGDQVRLLERNYRCRSKIADAAQRLVEHNSNRYPKRTIPATAGGAAVFEDFTNPAAELAYVANELTSWVSGRRSVASDLRNVAVLARTNKLARQFADHLSGLGISVRRRKHAEASPDWALAKLVVAAMANPCKDMLALRLLATKYGDEAAAGARAAAAREMRPVGDDPRLSALLSPTAAGLAGAMSSFGVSQESAARVSEICSGLARRAEPWTMTDLLARMHAGEDRAEDDGDGVTVTTFHGSKGREWETVFLVGAEEGWCPTTRRDSDLEEERRLFYVAMTRAASRLVITACRARQNEWNKRMEPRQRSRFVAEASIGCLQHVSNASADSSKSAYSLAEGPAHNGEQL